jgi:hypothetical protein
MYLMRGDCIEVWVNQLVPPQVPLLSTTPLAPPPQLIPYKSTITKVKLLMLTNKFNLLRDTIKLHLLRELKGKLRGKF